MKTSDPKEREDLAERLEEEATAWSRSIGPGKFTDLLRQAAARIRELEGAKDRLEEKLKETLAVVAQCGGTALGLAMSGSNHPDPDGALMGLFDLCTNADKSARSLLKSGAE